MSQIVLQNWVSGFHGIPSAGLQLCHAHRQTDRQARYSAATEVNQDCSVGKVSTLQIQKSSNRIIIRCRNKIFSLLQKIQACCVATYRAIQWVAAAPYRGQSVKRPDLEVNYCFHHHLVWIDWFKIGFETLRSPIHLDLNWRYLSAQYQFKGALFLS